MSYLMAALRRPGHVVSDSTCSAMTRAELTRESGAKCRQRFQIHEFTYRLFAN